MSIPAPQISHASSTQTTNPVSAEKKSEKASSKRDFPGILQLWQSKTVLHLQHLDNFIHSFYLWESETPRPISILKAMDAKLQKKHLKAMKNSAVNESSPNSFSDEEHLTKLN